LPKINLSGQAETYPDKYNIILMKYIIILASGNGSNAENIIRYFQESDRDVKVEAVLCNRREAGVYARAERLGVDALHMPKNDFNNPEILLPFLREKKIDLIVLAGFLLMVPDFLLKEYDGRILNIHPSLLPKYGGKGMYGHFIHEAVVAAGEKETGISIHKVSEICDAGEVIFQAVTEVLPSDTAEDVERKIHALEQAHFPKVIESYLNTLP